MPEDDLVYKIWLNLICGHDPAVIAKCLENVGSAEEIFKSDVLYRKMHSALRMSLKLKAKRELSGAREILECCHEKGISVIPFGDKRYPKRLSEIDMPPQLLYVKGELPDIDNLVCVSIVGSRNCSDYGKSFAKELAYNLAKTGILVLSGMALGIDASAHTGALNAGHITAAVLAGGADVVYPSANRNLYEQIIEHGAIISERPPGTIGRKEFYRQRNRLIVGMSNGVVIVEGAEKSGTKLTANWAISANRDLFAVPGKPTDKGSELPNSLIKDAAKLITSAEDVVEEYISVYPVELKNGMDIINEARDVGSSSKYTYNLPELKRDTVPDFEKYDENSGKILRYLYESSEAKHIDEISRELNIGSGELSFCILQLVMSKEIQQHPGEYYSFNHKN